MPRGDTNRKRCAIYTRKSSEEGLEQEFNNRVRPIDHIDVFRPLLPDRYSPLQPNGNGLQSVYLTELPTTLTEVLIGLIGQEVAPIVLAAGDVKPVSADDLDFWKRRLVQELLDDPAVEQFVRQRWRHRRLATLGMHVRSCR